MKTTEREDLVRCRPAGDERRAGNDDDDRRKGAFTFWREGYTKN
jgi:hypothetical protein